MRSRLLDFVALALAYLRRADQRLGRVRSAVFSVLFFQGPTRNVAARLAINAGCRAGFIVGVFSRDDRQKKGTLRRKAGSVACLFVACLAQNIFLAETFFIFSLLGLFKVFVATLGSMSGGLCAQRVAPLALKLAVSWSLLRNCLAAGCAGSLVVSKDDARRSLFDTARDRPSLLEESKCLYGILR